MKGSQLTLSLWSASIFRKNEKSFCLENKSKIICQFTCIFLTKFFPKKEAPRSESVKLVIDMKRLKRYKIQLQTIMKVKYKSVKL